MRDQKRAYCVMSYLMEGARVSGMQAHIKSLIIAFEITVLKCNNWPGGDCSNT